LKLRDLLQTTQKKDRAITPRFKVLAVANGDKCAAHDFIFIGQKSTESTRDGLLVYLERMSELGFCEDTQALYKIARKDKDGNIFEFKKGDLRLFFFKGVGVEIIICTDGVMKKTNKADKHQVDRAMKLRDEYFEASKNSTLDYE
jgi:hypothetical protein